MNHPPSVPMGNKKFVGLYAIEIWSWLAVAIWILGASIGKVWFVLFNWLAFAELIILPDDLRLPSLNYTLLSKAVFFAIGATTAAVTIGLRRRRNWARFLAIGIAGLLIVQFTMCYLMFGRWSSVWAGVGSSYWNRDGIWWDILFSPSNDDVGGSIRWVYIFMIVLNLWIIGYLSRPKVAHCFSGRGVSTEIPHEND